MNLTRILVVDDDSRLSGLVRVILEANGGYEVREENRSAQAIQSAREFQPHKIILDVDMPGMDGGEVAVALQEDPFLCRIPRLFLTSLISRNETGASTVRRGEDIFLAKPVEPALLLSSIKALGQPVAAQS